VVLLLLGAILAFGQAASNLPSDGTLTVAEYRAQLSVVAGRLERTNADEADEFLKAFPPSWKVAGDRDHFEFSTKRLRTALEHARKDAKQWPDVRSRVAAELRALAVEAAAYDHQPVMATGVVDPHDATRRNWWDEAKAKIYGWIWRLFGRFLTSAASWSGTKYVIYGITAAVACMFGFWIWRLIRPKGHEFEPPPETEAVSARHWTNWLQASRVAAESGDWREAVHLAYWAAISFLEAQGMWRPDRARTPREYLRLIGETNPSKPALADLTRGFERTWYAQRPATSDDYSRTLQHLETIGCR
jgi:hypothetical protein